MSSEEWTSGLPQNKLRMSVVNKQNENRNCMFCLRNSKTVEAKHWCKNCFETICDDCKFIHSYVPNLQNHTIVSLSDVENVNKKIEIEEPCPIHKGKFLEVIITITFVAAFVLPYIIGPVKNLGQLMRYHQN